MYHGMRRVPSEIGENQGVGIQRSDWGVVEGQPVYLYEIDNGQGIRCLVSNYGVTITQLWAPDRSGKPGDVVLGFDTLADHLERSMYFGCVIGRYGNRIGHGRFELNGETFTLATNNDPGGIPCHLHGGLKGFDKMAWASAECGENAVEFTLTSPDGDEGYPGDLQIRHVVSLTERGLHLLYEATTDRDTVVNLTNHSYFNLAGEGSGDILSHNLTVAASAMTPTDAGMIPTGEIRSVEGTPFDFRTPHRIGERIEADDEQLRFGGGYDHNWVLDAPGFAARLHDPASGRVMEVHTTEPGIQFYCGNFLDGRVGKGGKPYVHRGGLCLETQHYPDSPNHPNFPSTTLRAGETYRSETEFRFSIDES